MLHNVVINHAFRMLKYGVWSPSLLLLTQLQLTLLSLPAADQGAPHMLQYVVGRLSF